MRHLKIIEKYFETSKTFQDLSTFSKVIKDLLAIIEKYFEGFKTFQDLSNFRKVIFDLLAIEKTIKNHRKLFLSLQDTPGLKESYFGPSGKPGDF